MGEAPPFDRTPLDPGYIKGYGPGIRENGGQYTHAAIWSVIAFAMLGEGEKAGDLFIDPCIPGEWEGFEITYRHGDTSYRLTIENPAGVCRGVSRISLDGASLPGDGPIPLVDDGGEHLVRVELG